MLMMTSAYTNCQVHSTSRVAAIRDRNRRVFLTNSFMVICIRQVCQNCIVRYQSAGSERRRMQSKGLLSVPEVLNIGICMGWCRGVVANRAES